MKWYEAVNHAGIRPVEIVKETEHFVVNSDGQRRQKSSDWRWYRPTFDEAKQAALLVLRREAASARNTAEKLEERVKKFEAMKETA